MSVTQEGTTLTGRAPEAESQAQPYFRFSGVPPARLRQALEKGKAKGRPGSRTEPRSSTSASQNHDELAIPLHVLTPDGGVAIATQPSLTMEDIADDPTRTNAERGRKFVVLGNPEDNLYVDSDKKFIWGLFALAICNVCVHVVSLIELARVFGAKGSIWESWDYMSVFLCLGIIARVVGVVAILRKAPILFTVFYVWAWGELLGNVAFLRNIWELVRVGIQVLELLVSWVIRQRMRQPMLLFNSLPDGH